MDSTELKPLCVYLVRHGETEWSLSHRHTGWTDISLTAHGEIEAKQLAPRLKSVHFDSVFSSPQQRARRTCALAGLCESAQVDPDLVEWDYGDYEGQLTVDIRHKRENWNIFQDGCPNGETPIEVSNRADRVIARLRSLGGTIVLFSHGHFGSSLAARWIGLPLNKAGHLILSTGSISILSIDTHHHDIPVITLWNDVSAQAQDISLSASPVACPTPVREENAIGQWENEGGESSEKTKSPVA